MRIKHSSVLRSALINAPRETHGTGYSIYLVGANTRNAILAMLDAVEETFHGLGMIEAEPEDRIAAALRTLDGHIS